MDHLRKLPKWCYARMDDQSVRIVRGATEAEPIPHNEMWVRTSNHYLGITEEVLTAMMNGVLFGWDHPSTHVEVPIFNMTVSIPITVAIKVEGYSADDAIALALEKLTLPESFEIDGGASVIQIEAVT